MRLLEYRQDLFGRGYTVISGNKHYEEMCEWKCLPIRMHRLMGRNNPCDFFEDLVENLRFSYDLNEGTKEEHLEKYANILLGKSPEWRIIAFQVTVGAVYIDLYNTKTERISFFSLETDEYGFDLRFEVPHADGGPCSIYDVNIGRIKPAEKNTRTTVPQYANPILRKIGFFRKNPDINEPAKINARTTVTEYIDHVRREIEFRRKAPNSDELYIEVTEYADM